MVKNLAATDDAEDVVTKGYVDTGLGGKAPSSHDHDAAYASTGHGHGVGEVTDLGSDSKTEADNHTTYPYGISILRINQGNGDWTLSSGYLVVTTTKTTQSVNGVIQEVQEWWQGSNRRWVRSSTSTTTWGPWWQVGDSHSHPYASEGHNHNGSYYTEAEIDGFLSGKSDTDHSHPQAPASDTPPANPEVDDLWIDTS